MRELVREVIKSGSTFKNINHITLKINIAGFWLARISIFTIAYYLKTLDQDYKVIKVKSPPVMKNRFRGLFFKKRDIDYYSLEINPSKFSAFYNNKFQELSTIKKDEDLIYKGLDPKKLSLGKKIRLYIRRKEAIGINRYLMEAIPGIAIFFILSILCLSKDRSDDINSIEKISHLIFGSYYFIACVYFSLFSKFSILEFFVLPFLASSGAYFATEHSLPNDHIYTFVFLKISYNIMLNITCLVRLNKYFYFHDDPGRKKHWFAKIYIGHLKDPAFMFKSIIVITTSAIIYFKYK